MSKLHFEINDLFWTFQGEGFNAGTRALFVRMPHCNLRCSWCDTEFDSSTSYDDKTLADFFTSEASRFAVLTGGEPLWNKDSPGVVKLLKSLGFKVAVETNGVFPRFDGIDWVTCSPKRDAQYKINRKLYDFVNEFKYVVDDDFDFSILDRHSHDKARCHYLSPEFNNMEANLCKITEYIRENPRWRISLQTHKWMGIK